jgi:hypothetical protein
LKKRKKKEEKKSSSSIPGSPPHPLRKDDV